MLIDLRRSTARSSQANLFSSLEKSGAVIEFDPNGIILNASKDFLALTGYSIPEIVGQHHRIFVDSNYAKTEAYDHFWRHLREGRYETAVFERRGKGGKPLWLQATYIPVRDKTGKIASIVKLASDDHVQQLENIDMRGKVTALSRVQAVIEFDLEGIILTANQNFLDAVGYSLEEIKGKHHSMFVDPAARDSNDYRQFWQTLRSGKYLSARYKRRAKGGREIWLQASYNPILDNSGKPIKVVKFATDITERQRQNADYRGKVDALSKAQAIIEFELDGTIITANENFLNTVGYSLEEVVGRHHSLFVDPSFKKSPEYTDFWKALARGEFQSGEFKRIGKDGRAIWLEATYNPIVDDEGTPFKVVKFALDTTQRVQAKLEQDRIAKSIFDHLDEIQSATGKAHAKAETAISASNETNTMVETVAAAAEELDQSVQEIAQTVAGARDASDRTHEETRKANESTEQLTEAANAMNRIVDLIEDIAEQINLLALNATIESARAGDAGRGFAVVANEVKTLANQVASATGQISSEIKSLQGSSTDVANRLQTITDAVNELQSGVTGIAGAVEEQSVVTREISANMQTAATAVGDTNRNLTDLFGDIAIAYEHMADASAEVLKIRAHQD